MKLEEERTIERLAELLACYMEAQVKQDKPTAEGIITNLPSDLTTKTLETAAAWYAESSKEEDKMLVISMLQAIVNNYSNLPEAYRKNLYVSMFDYLAYRLLHIAKETEEINSDIKSLIKGFLKGGEVV